MQRLPPQKGNIFKTCQYFSVGLKMLCNSYTEHRRICLKERSSFGTRFLQQSHLSKRARVASSALKQNRYASRGFQVLSAATPRVAPCR